MKRGDIFEGKYQVLWPGSGYPEEEAKNTCEWIGELGKSRKEEVEIAETICQKALGLLQDFAEKLRRIVCGELKTNAFALECEFRVLWKSGDYRDDQSPGREKSKPSSIQK
ncbi:MAG: hypothetical protein V8Q57_07735 [Blautia sp.]